MMPTIRAGASTTEADRAWKEFQSEVGIWQDRFNRQIGALGTGAREQYERVTRADQRFREAIAALDRPPNARRSAVLPLAAGLMLGSIAYRFAERFRRSAN